MDEQPDGEMRILVVSTADWDHPFWTNKQHVTMALAAEGHEVLYVESLGIRTFSRESVHDSKRVWKRLRRFFRRPREVASNVFVVSPLVLPVWASPSAVLINRLALRLQTILWRAAWGRWDAIWTYSPMTMAAFSVGKLPLLYHCVDNIAAQPGMPRVAIERYERELVNRADLVYATAHDLSRRLALMGARHVVEHTNVVDYNHFSRGEVSLAERRGDGDTTIRKRIGFVGALSRYKVDLVLVRKLAVAYPDAEVVLIGQIGEGQPGETLEELRDLSNVVLLGPRKYSELPELMAGFDVGLLPVPINEYTKSMFPMKFFEYLACGVPVVSTAIPSLSDFEGHAYFSDSHEEFIRNIAAAMGADSEWRNRGRSLASSYTYEYRTRAMTKELQQLVTAGEFGKPD